MNRLLMALPSDARSCWREWLEPVPMRPGEVLYEANEAPHHVLFPLGGVVSLLSVMECGTATEVALVGNEGLVGVAIPLTGQPMPHRALVQIGGRALRMKPALLANEFDARLSVRRVLLGYTQQLITQVAQVAACNRHHTIRQQLCRWLLQVLDRVESPRVQVTQELIANTLGVRREGVAVAANQLQKAGFILYRRGTIDVLDRPGLELNACECYHAIRHPCRPPAVPAPRPQAAAWLA